VTAVVNTPFYYQIKAAGATSYFAVGLPPGWSQPDALGQIKGTFTSVSGPYTIALKAFNASGATQAILHLTVSSGTTGAQTPAGYVVYGSDKPDLQLPSTGPAQTLTFTPGSQPKYYLSLDSRFQDPSSDKGGINYCLGISVNSTILDSTRLVNVNTDPAALPNGDQIHLYRGVPQTFASQYSGDWNPLDPAHPMYSPYYLGLYPYNYVLDVTDLIHANQENTITFSNPDTTSGAKEVIRNVLLLPNYTSNRTDLNPTPPNVGVVTPTTSQAGYTLTEEKSNSATPLGLTVKIGTEVYRINTLFSAPGVPQGFYNHLGDDPAHESRWTSITSANDGNPYDYKAVYGDPNGNPVYTVYRVVHAYTDHIEIYDGIINNSSADLGIILNYSVPTPSLNFSEVRATGVPMNFPNFDTVEWAESLNTMNSPTLYLQQNSTGLGMVFYDDVCRANCYINCNPSQKTLQNRSLKIPKGSFYVTGMMVFPTAKPDYYTFINSYRGVLGLNSIKIDGNLATSYGWIYNPDAVSDGEITSLIDNANASYVELDTTVDPNNPAVSDWIQGSAFMSQKGAIIQANVAKMIARIHALRPQVKTVPYIDTFVTSEDNVFPTTSKYQDSALLDDKDPTGKTPLYYHASFGLLPYMLPQLTNRADNTVMGTNSYGAAIEQFVSWLRTNADGMFWDESSSPWAPHGPSGIFSIYAYFNSDVPPAGATWFTGGTAGTGLIDPNTFQLQPELIENMALASLSSRKAIATDMISHGKTLWMNYQPATTSETYQAIHYGHMYRFMEGIDPVDPLRSHLSTPLCLNDTYMERTDADIATSIRRRISYGTLPLFYYLKFANGGNIMQDIYPFTPIALHSGYIIGQEKILTTSSGTFGWVGSNPNMRVRIYDANGYKTTEGDNILPTVLGGNSFIVLTLQNGETALISKDGTFPAHN